VKPVIQIGSGAYFDLLNPDPATVRVEDIAAALSRLCRFTGHCRRFYSVAQHSTLVSRLVPPELARWGLYHDAAEAYLGDVASPLKRLLPDYKAIEHRVEEAVFAALGLYGPMPPEVKRADLVALAAEKHDLLPWSEADHEHWSNWITVDIEHEALHRVPSIYPMQDTEVVRENFLFRATQLERIAIAA
jgi:hypothetical protein